MNICDHHECDGEPAIWRATDRAGGVLIGEFCAEHLGDGIDGIDQPIHLEPVWVAA